MPSGCVTILLWIALVAVVIGFIALLITAPLVAIALVLVVWFVIWLVDGKR